MSKKPMMYYLSPIAEEFVNQVQKNSKSKFINLCVEKVISNPRLIEEVKNELLGFPSGGSNKTELPTVNATPANIQTIEQVDNTSEANEEAPGVISRNKVKFGFGL